MWFYPTHFGQVLLMLTLSFNLTLGEDVRKLDSCLVCSYAENHFPLNEDKDGDNNKCLEGAKLEKFKKTCKSGSCIKLSGVSPDLGEIMLRNCSTDFRSEDYGKCLFIKTMSMELVKKTSKPLYLNDVRICICNSTNFCNDEPGAEAKAARSRSSSLSFSPEHQIGFQIVVEIMVFYLINNRYFRLA